MINTIIFAIVMILIAIGVWSQVRKEKKELELNCLQIENEELKKEFLAVKIKEQKFRLRALEREEESEK